MSNHNITNTVLVEELMIRNYEEDSIISDFECFMCQKIQQQANSISANKLHYDCANSAVYPKMLDELQPTAGINSIPKYMSDWQYNILQGKCEADLFNEFVTRNRTFTESEFNSKLLTRYDKGICGLK